MLIANKEALLAVIIENGTLFVLFSIVPILRPSPGRPRVGWPGVGVRLCRSQGGLRRRGLTTHGPDAIKVTVLSLPIPLSSERSDRTAAEQVAEESDETKNLRGAVGQRNDSGRGGEYAQRRSRRPADG
jgi:hypothetical protein